MFVLLPYSISNNHINTVACASTRRRVNTRTQFMHKNRNDPPKRVCTCSEDAQPLPLTQDNLARLPTSLVPPHVSLHAVAQCLRDCAAQNTCGGAAGAYWYQSHGAVYAVRWRIERRVRVAPERLVVTKEDVSLHCFFLPPPPTADIVTTWEKLRNGEGAEIAGCSRIMLEPDPSLRMTVNHACCMLEQAEILTTDEDLDPPSVDSQLQQPKKRRGKLRS